VIVEVRAAAPEEWRRVRALRLRALEDSPDAFGSTLEGERDHEEADWRSWISGWEGASNALFVAIRGEAWIGMAVGSHEEGRDRTHVYGMWVEPAARRLDLGTRLLRAVLDWSAERAVATVELAVTETNGGARAFYERNGFEDSAARHPLREGSRLSVIVMRRALAAG
jgi:ribosomal protein S18 acetylase RimI-like enzyme